MAAAEAWREWRVTVTYVHYGNTEVLGVEDMRVRPDAMPRLMPPWRVWS